MKHFLLIYTTAPDYLERRGQYRDAHLAHAWAAADRGEMVIGGACAPPESLGILMFQGENGNAAERFAQNDPYVQNGVVEKWRVVEWQTVIGDMAANPLRPE